MLSTKEARGVCFWGAPNDDAALKSIPRRSHHQVDLENGSGEARYIRGSVLA